MDQRRFASMSMSDSPSWQHLNEGHLSGKPTVQTGELFLFVDESAEFPPCPRSVRRED
jgi:hypothetical protein